MMPKLKGRSIAKEVQKCLPIDTSPMRRLADDVYDLQRSMQENFDTQTDLLEAINCLCGAVEDLTHEVKEMRTFLQGEQEDYGKLKAAKLKRKKT